MDATEINHLNDIAAEIRQAKTTSRSMKISNHPQRSEQWHAERRGIPTASCFSQIITPARGDLSKSSVNYMDKLLVERLTPPGMENDLAWIGFEGNYWTDRGTELEPLAIAAFEAETGLVVCDVGFVTDDTGVAGASPDGLIQDHRGAWKAGLEVKCPSPYKHIQTVISGEMPDEHKPQVHGGMAITGLNEWYFMSFCPGVAPIIVKVVRDDYTARLESALIDFQIQYGQHLAEWEPKLRRAMGGIVETDKPAW